MNKKHWITVQLDGSLPEGLLEELIEDSYDLIVDKLPARDQALALGGLGRYGVLRERSGSSLMNKRDDERDHHEWQRGQEHLVQRRGERVDHLAAYGLGQSLDGRRIVGVDRVRRLRRRAMSPGDGRGGC